MGEQESRVDDELMRHLRDDEEIEISTTKKDGTAVSVTIWSVAAGRAAYVRSVHGERGAWYRRALARDGNGVEVRGRVHPVALLPVDDEAELAAVDAALRTKYATRWPDETESLMVPESRMCTLRVQRRG